MPRRVVLLTGVSALALLTYCGVQKGENLNSAVELPPPTTIPWDEPAGKMTVYDLAADSQVALEGATNISDWSSSSSQARARVILDVDDSAMRTILDKLQTGKPASDPMRLPLGRPAIAELSVPVMSMRGNSQGMDRDMHLALKASQFPFIQYRLEKVQDAQVRQDTSSGKPEILLHVIGVLTVAGVQRTLATELTIQRDAGQHYLVHARTPIKMTDFGVTPPDALFGLIHARDSLSVIFNLDFTSSGANK
jgi:hydrogenase maturation factor